MSSHVGAINSATALIQKAFQQPKGDFADRLNSRVTVCVLALSSVLMLSGHFMGDPITCWTPAQYIKQWHDWVNQYCYVHGTYFAPLEDELAYNGEQRKNIPINYYQWVPYILAVQAFFFYIPRFVWKSLIAHSGYDLSAAVQYVNTFWSSIRHNDAAFKARVAAFECRVAVFLWDGLKLARHKNSRDMPLYYTVFLGLQALNAWMQWYVLNSLLQSPMYSFWGPNIVLDLMEDGDSWMRTGHFPRIVHCDFNKRAVASSQLETVQCVLGLNIYYEKLFLFLWFWFLFVAIVSTISGLYWGIAICRSRKARNMIDIYLASHPNPTHISREKFMRILGKDGVFLIQQMSQNLGEIPTSYLTVAMRNTCDLAEEESDDEEQLLKSEQQKIV